MSEARKPGRPKKMRVIPKVVAGEAVIPAKSMIGVPRTSQMDRVRALAMKRLRLACPARWAVPNIAQERMFRLFRRKPYPSDAVFMAGNGVGKSVAMVLFSIGIIWGADELGTEAAMEDKSLEFLADLEVFRTFRETAQMENRPISIRWIVNPGSMKPNGAMYQRLRAWFPKGLYEMQKLGTTYFSQVLCWENEEDVGDEAKIVAIIDVKSHDQGVVAHSGSDIDIVMFDEPCPEEIYDEAVARGRGNPDSFRAFFLTPLELSGWLIDRIIDHADGHKIAYCQGSLWDNCKDWHPDEKLRGKTRGNLTRAKIEEQIEAWKRSSPEMLEARLNGTPTHLSGALYKTFNPEIHIKRGQMTIPNDWPIWMVIDPHHGRAPAIAWFAQGPTVSYCIAEWPNDDYVRMDPKPIQISMLMEIIRKKEMNFERQVIHRFGDPNSLKFPYPNSNMTIQQEYANQGMTVRLSDDNLDVGHSKVQEALATTPDFPIPKFQILEYDLFTGEPMLNVPVAMGRYGFKNNIRNAKSPSSLLDQTYKDFADVVRYFFVSADMIPFQRIASTSQAVASIVGTRKFISRS